MSTQEFDLNNHVINSPEARAEIKKVQQAFDDLLDVIDVLKKELLHNVTVIDEAKELISTLQTSSMGFTASLKRIHSMLGQRKDLFIDDTDMDALMDELSKYVMDNAVIKAGVIENAVEGKNNGK